VVRRKNERYLGKPCGETVEKDIFDDDDIREIADHLYAYLREKRVEE